MRTLYLDCFSGISGDMTVGALIDAGASFDAIQAGLRSLGVPGFTVTAEKTKKKGIEATQFLVLVEENADKPHRHLRHIVEIINRGELPEPVKAAAIETFQLLGEAEAAVHGTTVEKVHFHEVGAIDSIVDIVAAQYGFHLLGIEQVFCSPLHVGAGTVKCDHGVMPVPAPATARLLQGKPIYGGEVQGELVTPTGAASVAQRVKAFGNTPILTVDAIGYGSGTRDLPDRANVLRVLLGEAAAAPMATESITVVEAAIDDMNPELLPTLTAALLDAGARDAFLTPILGKKGRPAYCVTALCDDARTQEIARALFAHSTTLGLRMRQERRIVLDRAWRKVLTPWGEVRVKVGMFDGAASTTAPEFEDCRALAERAGVPVRRVYEAALAAAFKGEEG
jgi:uncharacterized protein (TIGR00299 family) protein